MLRDDAMIVRLSISQWTARKFDKGISQRVAKEYGTESDVGRYNKVLIAKEAIQKITRAASAARDFHYQNTLAWDDSGARLLPVKNFKTYSEEMRKLHEDFDNASIEFVDSYEDYREEARDRLAGMFNAEDYPSRSEIVDRYGFHFDIDPVPSGDDFRVSLQVAEQDRIMKELDSRVKDRLKEATDELFHRLADVVNKFADKLKDGDAIFRDSLVGNIVELVELLPKLNVAKDPKLEALRKEVQRKLVVNDPASLRHDKDVRSKAVDNANAIVDKMSAYLA